MPKEQLLMQKGQIITNLRKELDQERESEPARRKTSYDHRRTRRREKEFHFDSKPIKDWGENIGSSLERYIGSILESVSAWGSGLCNSLRLCG